MRSMPSLPVHLLTAMKSQVLLAMGSEKFGMTVTMSSLAKKSICGGEGSEMLYTIGRQPWRGVHGI